MIRHAVLALNMEGTLCKDQRVALEAESDARQPAMRVSQCICQMHKD